MRTIDLYKRTPLDTFGTINHNEDYMNNIQGYGYYCGEQVTIIDSYKDMLLIISSHNPIESEWVKYSDIDNTTWIIGTQVA